MALTFMHFITEANIFTNIEWCQDEHFQMNSCELISAIGVGIFVL